MSKLTTEQLDDMAERAVATFWQGAIAAAPVTVLADWNAIVAALSAMAVGGVAAILSSVKNGWKANRTNRSAR